MTTVNLRRGRTGMSSARTRRLDSAIQMILPAWAGARPTHPPVSEDDGVERALVGAGVILAADFEARRVFEHAPHLFLRRRRSSSSASRPRRRASRKRPSSRCLATCEPKGQPARGSHDEMSSSRKPGSSGTA